jgi:hypothetical protein
MQVILKRLAVWFLEMALQAVMLGLFLIASSGYDEHAFGKDLLFFFNIIPLLLCTAGFLLCTGIILAAWISLASWSYPTIAAALFLIHFEVLNIGVGGAFEPPDRLRIRVAGVCLAFGCTFVGGWLLREWVTRNGPSAQHRIAPSNAPGV